MAKPIQRPQRFRRGQRLTKERLNPLVDGIDALSQQFGLSQPFGPHAPLAQFILTAEKGDYLVCRTYDGTTTGDTDVFIAKPHLLRRSITARNGLTYTYTSDSQRDANDGVDTETQVMTPGWFVDTTTPGNSDLVYAERVRRGTGVVVDVTDVPVLWLARGEGRHWAKQSA